MTTFSTGCSSHSEVAVLLLDLLYSVLFLFALITCIDYFFFSSLQFICCHKPTVLRQNTQDRVTSETCVNQCTCAYMWYLSRLEAAHMWA